MIVRRITLNVQDTTSGQILFLMPVNHLMVALFLVVIEDQDDPAVQIGKQTIVVM
jgi:hypothetical protein